MGDHQMRETEVFFPFGTHARGFLKVVRLEARGCERRKRASCFFFFKCCDIRRKKRPLAPLTQDPRQCTLAYV